MEIIGNPTEWIGSRLPRFLRRQRLLDRLEMESHKRLTLILGQAAQGKSKLALSFASSSQIPSVWLNLGFLHSDAEILHRSLLESLQPCRTRMQRDNFRRAPAGEFGPRERLPLYREWVGSAFEGLSFPIRVVVDGLDRLSPDASSLGFLQVLLDEAPQGAKFMMLSRSGPPFEIERMRVNQQATVIENHELAFTPAETSAFFSEIHNMLLSEELLGEIQRATEGWVGGLILVAEALSEVRAEDRESFILDKLPAVFTMRGFKYLGEQIFEKQPQETRDFLIKASLLDVIDSKFMNEFLGRGDAELILQQLIEKNLFVCPIHDGTGSIKLRFHRLLRGFLLSRFRALHGPHEESKWLVKASSIFERSGDLKSAIRYSVKAGNHARGAKLIEQLGFELLPQHRIGELTRWLKSLPPEIINDRPWLLLFLSISQRFARAAANVCSLQRALSLFEEQSSLQGHLLALACLIEASLVSDGNPNPLVQLISKGEALLRSLEADVHPFERALLWLQIGFAQRLRGGDPRKGFFSCQNAYILGKQLGNEVIQFNALSHALEALTLVGELSTAREFLKKAERLEKRNQQTDMKSTLLLHSSLLALFDGDVQKSWRLIQEAQATAEENGLVYLYPVTRMYALLIRIHLQEHEEVAILGGQLSEMTSTMGLLFINGVISFILGLNAYWHREYETAKRWMKKSEPLMRSLQYGSPYHANLIKVLKGILHYHSHGDPQGIGELGSAISYFDDIRCINFMVEARLCMALICWKDGDHEQARRYLKEAVEMAKQNGFRCFLLVSPEDCARAFGLALEYGLEGAEDWAASHLRTQASEFLWAELEKVSKHPKDVVAQKAKRLRISIHHSKKPRIRIRTLGRFEVFIGETQLSMDSKVWGGAMPRTLLKLMLALGPGSIPWEQLAEYLWPETDPDNGEKRLKANLHRLRKALEPDLDPVFGSSYVRFEGRRVSLNGDLCEVDLDEFLFLVAEGERAELAGRTKDASSSYRRAMHLYGGPFLSEELYSHAVEVRRVELQRRYIGLLNRFSKLLEGQNSLKGAVDCLQRILEIDPLDDDSCHELMTLYCKRGMRNQALRIYERYKEALQIHVGAEPDERIQAVRKKILDES